MAVECEAVSGDACTIFLALTDAGRDAADHCLNLGCAEFEPCLHDPDGRLLGILALPARPANLAWCDPDARGLAMTAVDAVYYVRLRVEGRMPPFLFSNR